MSSPSPYEPLSPEAEYWSARHELAKAARALNEKLVSTDIPPATALEIAARLRTEASNLSALPQVTGMVQMSRLANRGSVDNIMGELVAMAGRSHPSAPELTWEEATNHISGTVVFGQAFEGPPGHVHGGWVAGILDHLMGMTHVRMGQPGMTGGLSVRYLKPTPLGATLNIAASAKELDDRRTEVKAEMRHGETVTATAEAIFIRVDIAKFGFGAD